MITATGLGSGLDISGLVTQLVAAERSNSDTQLNRENNKLTLKVSALGELKSKLSEFQTSLSSLQTLNSFSKFTATSAVPEELTATASAGATENNYTLDISQLASSHALATTTFEDKDNAQVGTGTLTFRFGSTDYNSGSDTYNSFSLNGESEITTITIDETNNTLEGVMSAINNKNIGISASIINDGSGYRLLMTTEKTGAENSLEITVADDDANNDDASGLSVFAFNSSATNIQQTAVAEDALFTINGLSISSDSNKVDFAIEGVSLELKQATEFPIELEVKANTESVENAVTAFIGGYNEFKTTMNVLSSYNVDSNKAGALLGDFSILSMNGQIDRIIRNSVSGLDGSISTLSELGITSTDSGTLELDEATFSKLLKESPDDVARIFASIGTPTSADISFKSATEKTQIGNYNIEITKTPSSGVYTGAGNLPDFGAGGTLDIDDDNDNFSVEVDSVTAVEISLTQGTYTTGESLAAEIQARINGTANLKTAKVSVTVAYDNITNSLSITSNSIGKTSSVNISGVDINTTTGLGINNAAGVDGSDVEGTIGGAAATGSGNVLTADAGSPVEGLALVIAATSTGSYGSVNFTRGLASQLEVFFAQVLDDEGAMADRIESIQDQISDVKERSEELEIRWQAVEERYLRQFNALDILLANFQSTSEYLETQFEGLLEPNTGN